MESKGFFKDNQESMLTLAIMLMFFTGGENGTQMITLACWLAIWISVIKLMIIKRKETQGKNDEGDKK